MAAQYNDMQKPLDITKKTCRPSGCLALNGCKQRKAYLINHISNRSGHMAKMYTMAAPQMCGPSGLGLFLPALPPARAIAPSNPAVRLDSRKTNTIPGTPTQKPSTP